MDGDPAGHVCDAESELVRDSAEDLEHGGHGCVSSGEDQGLGPASVWYVRNVESAISYGWLQAEKVCVLQRPTAGGFGI
jgi:hypothetical protein